MVLDLFKLDGKVAIVTGASTGLGQGIAIALSDAGAIVVGADRSGAFETEKILKDKGRQFLGIKCDLSDKNSIDIIIEQTLKEFKKIDILVNNAGMIRRADALEVIEQDWDDVFNLNMKNLFFLSQEVAKVFISQKNGGKIINIASMLSYQGGIRVPAYTSTKSALMGLTKALANEWAGYNINVNAIAPGYMETNNTEQIRADKKRYADILARIPANRWGTPEDLQGCAVFLASDASNYINGFTIAVDGGWLAR